MHCITYCRALTLSLTNFVHYSRSNRHPLSLMLMGPCKVNLALNHDKECQMGPCTVNQRLTVKKPIPPNQHRPHKCDNGTNRGNKPQRVRQARKMPRQVQLRHPNPAATKRERKDAKTSKTCLHHMKTYWGVLK